MECIVCVRSESCEVYSVGGGGGPCVAAVIAVLPTGCIALIPGGGGAVGVNVGEGEAGGGWILHGHVLVGAPGAAINSDGHGVAVGRLCGRHVVGVVRSDARRAAV